ncbi:MAG: PAS domain-containing protein [Proteobacteria bacterium]|nr:PAS domain-containing protein [Pseudomonadota bacterium]MBU1061092.1 PAS domain-containing protein [Pseudomonadota bacterium]
MNFPNIGNRPKDYELIFKHLPMGIIYLDRDFTILNINPYFLEKFGVTLDNVRGRRCYELRAEILGEGKKRLKPCCGCKVPEAIETRDVLTFVNEVTPGFMAEITIVPVKNERGDVSGVIELVQDITQSLKADRELRDSKEKYKSVVDNIGIGVSLINPDMEIIAMNKQMYKWFPNIDVSKRPACFQAFNNPPRKNICSYCPTCKTLQDGQVHESVTETPFGNEIRNYRIISSPILNSEGKPTAAIEMVEDITESKKAKEKIQEYQNNLEELVKKRTKRLSVMNRELKNEITDRKEAEEALKISSNKTKIFAYCVSHDLKSPAIAIYGLTRLLNKHYEDVLDERGKNYCQQIMKSSEQIAALVEMINVYISTKEISQKIESIKLAELLFMIREEFADPLNIRQIKWTEPEYLPEIKADRIAILRVLRNFVDNALKYSGSDLSEIGIGYREDDEYHILSVSDDGIGLTEEESKNIFELFKRQTTSSGIVGSGLGLAIVREIAEQHKGKVWSEPGSKKGITFNLSISKDL